MENLFEEFATFRGFRLDWFEFLNWGIFNSSIYRIDFNLQNALLSGEIGSGKSTIVDAITTLLLPTNMIVYNKAAGAKAKERTIQSYILGEYKKSLDENGIAGVKRLRSEKDFSVLLAKFKNEGLMEEVYLGLFLGIKNSKVIKIYFLTRKKIEIKELVGFKNIREIKKYLKTKGEVFETYKEYFNAYKKILGIGNFQAMKLFYQMVSMKSVENLNSFIREHMLEKKDLDAIVDEMITSFKELKRAHDLILDAKEQIEILEVIEKTYKNYSNALKKLNKNRGFLEKLEGVFARFELKRKEEILKQKEILLENEKKTIKEKKAKKEHLSEKLNALKMEFNEKGGGRINLIDEKLKFLEAEFERKSLNLKRYKNLLKNTDFPFSRDYKEFLKLKDKIKTVLGSIEEKKEKTTLSLDSLKYSFKKMEEELNELEDEIFYLKHNKTNIPKFLSKIRDDIQKRLNTKLFFVAELIEVKNSTFEGVIERILRNFGMCLLVDENVYEEVNEYVNNTYLNAKLVYLKIKNKEYECFIDSNKKLLINNIEVKQSKFKDYIMQRIANEFDYILCDNLEEFKKYKKAATKEGLVKSGIRHTKDDRFEIDDKSRYILGSNEEKLKALILKRKNILQKKETLLNELNQKKETLKDLEKQKEVLKEILKTDFEEIDIFSLKNEIDALNSEKKSLLENRSLKELEKEIKHTEIDLKFVESEISATDRKIGQLESEKNRLKIDINELKKTAIEDKEFEREFNIKHQSLEKLKEKKKSIEKELKSKISSLETSKNNYQNHLIKKMTEYLQNYRFFEKFADANIESVDEFLNRLNKLRIDDLPRFEKDFRRHFEEGTLYNILKINEEINRSLKEIKNKIALINNSLKDIEYNPSTYIEIDIKPSKDKDLKEFRDTLKFLSSNIAEGLNENKFLKIKELISKLQGVDENIEKNWRNKVCDIRNYYTFAAIEKYFSGEIKEYYSDSSGKSGGQKEKLAYTILASALSYQFSLLNENPKSRTFRFAMIDEAFGKGSDESARYALNLFKKLDLQMLIITPKQKINVIAPYVGNIYALINQNNESFLINVGIEKFKK
jgi:uncharacterized protein YPO0396